MGRFRYPLRLRYPIRQPSRLHGITLSAHSVVHSAPARSERYPPTTRKNLTEYIIYKVRTGSQRAPKAKESSRACRESGSVPQNAFRRGKRAAHYGEAAIFKAIYKIVPGVYESLSGYTRLSRIARLSAVHAVMSSQLPDFSALPRFPFTVSAPAHRLRGLRQHRPPLCADVPDKVLSALPHA